MSKALSNFYHISNATQRKRFIDRKIFFVVNFLKKNMFDLFSKGGKDGQAVGRHSEQNLKSQYWSRSITIIGTIYLSQITILIYLVNFSFNCKYCHNIFVSDIWQLCLIPPTFFLSRSKVMLSRSTTQTEKATDFRRVWNDWIFWSKLLSNNQRIYIYRLPGLTR